MLSYDYALLHQKTPTQDSELKWDSDDVKAWKTLATEQQQNFYEFLRADRNTQLLLYDESKRTDLERKIAYAMYGPPHELPNAKRNSGTGYQNKHLKSVRKICDIILKQCGNGKVGVSFLFVCAFFNKVNISVPVFKVEIVGEEQIDTEFIDSNRREYKNWEDYLGSNKLPKCYVCFPVNGCYTATDGIVDVAFAESPACSLKETVFNVLDVTASLFAAALGVTALAIPVSAPIAIAAAVGGLASGMFGVSRGARTLVDRHTHGQTIGLNSEEARGGWLGMIGSTVGMALGSVNAVSSRVINGGKFVDLRAGVISLSIGASALKGLNIIDHFASIRNKFVNEEEVTTLDAFQMVSSVFFFTGSIVSTKSAFNAMKYMQSIGGETSTAEILNMIQTRSCLITEMTEAISSGTDGHGKESEKEMDEPEFVWPRKDEYCMRCTIL